MKRSYQRQTLVWLPATIRSLEASVNTAGGKAKAAFAAIVRSKGVLFVVARNKNLTIIKNCCAHTAVGRSEIATICVDIAAVACATETSLCVSVFIDINLPLTCGSHQHFG